MNIPKYIFFALQLYVTLLQTEVFACMVCILTPTHVYVFSVYFYVNLQIFSYLLSSLLFRMWLHLFGTADSQASYEKPHLWIVVEFRYHTSYLIQLNNEKCSKIYVIKTKKNSYKIKFLLNFYVTCYNDFWEIIRGLVNMSGKYSIRSTFILLMGRGYVKYDN